MGCGGETPVSLSLSHIKFTSYQQTFVKRKIDFHVQGGIDVLCGVYFKHVSQQGFYEVS